MREYRLLMLVDAIFVAVYAGVIAVLYELGRIPRSINTIDLMLLGLATARLSDIVSTDEVMEWLRRPFVKLEPTEIADRKVETRGGRGTGVRKVIGDLLCCPWCIAVWVAAALSYAYFIAPRIAWLFILVMAIAEIGALLQTFSTILVRLEKYFKGLGVPGEGL